MLSNVCFVLQDVLYVPLNHTVLPANRDFLRRQLMEYVNNVLTTVFPVQWLSIVVLNAKKVGH